MPQPLISDHAVQPLIFDQAPECEPQPSGSYEHRTPIKHGFARVPNVGLCFYHEQEIRIGSRPRVAEQAPPTRRAVVALAFSSAIGFVLGTNLKTVSANEVPAEHRGQVRQHFAELLGMPPEQVVCW